eukprot:m.160395 g.160395  ORF g.160395 m.160395 type:complete len:147 (+) comp14350_c0_seq4:488-928(+)
MSGTKQRYHRQKKQVRATNQQRHMSLRLSRVFNSDNLLRYSCYHYFFPKPTLRHKRDKVPFGEAASGLSMVSCSTLSAICSESEATTVASLSSSLSLPSLSPSPSLKSPKPLIPLSLEVSHLARSPSSSSSLKAPPALPSPPYRCR